MSPLYDYRCPKCGYFEETRPRDDILIPCPSCGKTARRYPSVPTVITESGGKSLPGTPLRPR